MNAIFKYLKKSIFKDPLVSSILKRSLIIISIFSAVSIGAAKLVDDLPFFSFGIIIFISILVGLLNQWSYDRNDTSLSWSEVFLETVLLTAVAWGTCSIILFLALHDRFYLSAGVLFFLLPTTFSYIREEHRSRPRQIREGVILLPWLEARVDYAIVPSKYFIVFHAGKQDIGYPVDRMLIKNVSLQELWSNYVHRHNATALQSDLVNPIGLFFFKKRRLWFAWKYANPTAALKNLHFRWKWKLRMIKGKRKLIKVIYLYVDVEILSHN